MKNIIKKSLQALLIVPVIAFGVSVLSPAVATVAAAGDCGAVTGTNLDIRDAAQCSQGTGQQSELTGSTGAFTIITNVLLFIIGAISVIMLIIGGIRYTISGGDSTAVTNAKNTILYAIVGIVVALLAYALVNFVIGSFVAP